MRRASRQMRCDAQSRQLHNCEFRLAASSRRTLTQHGHLRRLFRRMRSWSRLGQLRSIVWASSSSRNPPTQPGRLQRQTRQAHSCLQCWQGQRSSFRASSVAGIRQHILGFCNGRPGRHIAGHSAGKGSGAAYGRVQSQEFANTALAFATADQAGTLLFTVLARAAEQRLGELKSQELANTAWAFATADQAYTHCCSRRWQRQTRWTHCCS